MSDAAMTLSPEQFDAIGDYVRSHLREWLGGRNGSGPSERELELRERTIRIEESLKHSIELAEQRHAFMERHFSMLDEQLEKRFEQIDKRFEQVDKRFEQVDKRFEQVDKRFDDLIHFMDKRFEQVDRRFSQMFAYFTTGFVILGVLMSVYRFLA